VHESNLKTMFKKVIEIEVEVRYNLIISKSCPLKLVFICFFFFSLYTQTSSLITLLVLVLIKHIFLKNHNYFLFLNIFFKIIVIKTTIIPNTLEIHNIILNN